MRYDASGPWILWLNHGCDGWQPRSFDTYDEALRGERYGEEFAITELAVGIKPDHDPYPDGVRWLWGGPKG